MKSSRFTNFLLVCIAVLLALIAYNTLPIGSGIDFVPSAHAAAEAKEVSKGCYFKSGRCIPVDLRADSKGYLLVKVAKVDAE